MAGTGVGVGISERVALTTIAKWMKKLSVQTIEKYALLSVLQKKGLIEYGCHGGELRWVFQFKDPPLNQYVDGAAKTWQRNKYIADAALPWRGYDHSEVITLQEKLEHGGEEAKVEIFNKREKRIRQGLIRQLGKEWYKDGNATGNESTFHGVESFCSMTGQTAADEFATTPNDSYAGNSTAYATFKTGATKGTDEEYGVWSPTIVNTNRTPSGGSLRNWENYADEYLRLGILENARGNTSEEQCDLVLLTKAGFRDLLNIMDDKERVNVQRGQDVGMVKLGFKHFVSIDGVDVGWDLGINAADSASDVVSGYGFNTDALSLKILGGKKRKTLFGARVTWNDDHASDRFYFYLLGNLCFESPRQFIKFAAIS